MNDCLFCKIINNEIPAQKVYEDDHVVGFLDIHPVNFGHTLIVPKKHSVNIMDADDETLSAMAIAAKKISKALMTLDGYDGVNLHSNNNASAGQVIFHIHWHVIPRTSQDGLRHWPGKSYEAGSDAAMADTLKQALSHVS